MANVKATDLIEYTRASKGHALAKVSYGEELVTNGTFDTNTTGWTLTNTSGTATFTHANQEATFTRQTFGDKIHQEVSCVVDRIYKVSCSLTAVSGGTARVRFNSANSTTGDNAVADSTSSGEFSLIVVANASTMYFVFDLNANGASVTIDNISVKEVTFNQADGTLQLFEHPNNIPRIEYDADGNLLGLLIEESRTNLVVSSEDFTTGWSRSNILAFGSGSTSNAIAAPDGTTTADLIVPTTASNNSHFVRTTAQPSVGVGTVATFSVFVKAAGYTSLSLRLVNTDAPIINYDLTAITASDSDGSITAVGNGWYRCTIKGASTTGAAWPWIYPNQQATFAGDGTSGIYVWGAQVEAGSFPTSYIKTTGSTASRSADVASIDVDQFGYNQNEGTFVSEFQAKASNGTIGNLMTVFAASDNTTSNRIRANSTQGLEVAVSGVAQATLSSSFTANFEHKYASAYKENDFAFSQDGGTASTDTSGTIPAVTQLEIGRYLTGRDMTGHIKSIKYFPKRLSNAKLQELTS